MNTVTIGKNEYKMIKTGRAQAEQVLALTRWISKYGLSAIKQLQDEGGGEIAADTGWEFLSKIVEYLTADALIDLFQAMTGCTKKEAEEYFDIAILIDVIIEVYEGNPSVRRLIDRFFSEPDSEETEPEE